ncbi:MAG: nucleoside deaminase [Candidatus Omnitrophica bacterium]|nr:nucleoside deaminase [Candidatus Omnitrophota bacterium]MDD5670524.1 nucleoside deaminase [Candidatus Omnitrophota bacterium]
MSISADKKFMRCAIKKARQGIRTGQTPFGTCIVRNGKIVGLAHNTVWQTTDITAHAEVHAIRQACRKLKTVDLSGCTLYSTCEPCPMCFSACHWAKITEIVYGTRIADAQKIGFSELSISNRIMKKLGRSPVLVRGDFLRKENLKLFRDWSRLKNKRAY